MMTDILTVAWKEFREILAFGDSRARSKFSILLVIVVFGVFMPLQGGREWFTSSFSVVIWGWMPYMWVFSVVADTFAGERERHTLEALLATRLSDKSILFGKLLTTVAYGFLLTWIILLVSLVTVNVVFGGQGLLFFPFQLLLTALVFSFLIAGLSASIGILVSLRAGSARQAQQWMSAGMMVLFLPLMFLQFLPASWLSSINSLLKTIQPQTAAVWIASGLAVVETILIAIALRLFKRSRLILD